MYSCPLACACSMNGARVVVRPGAMPSSASSVVIGTPWKRNAGSARLAVPDETAALTQPDPGGAGPLAVTVSTTSSPSSRNPRLSPLGSLSGSLPRAVSSSRQPRSSFPGPETVPLREQIAGAEIAAVTGVVGDQLGQGPVHLAETAGSAGRGHAFAPHPGGEQPTSTVQLDAPVRPVGGVSRYGSGSGSPAGRGNDGTRNGASASIVTTHGDTVVAKFFARNGPRG